MTEQPLHDGPGTSTQRPRGWQHSGINQRVTSRYRRLCSADRAQGVDLARGIALVGMLAAHLLVIPALHWGEPASWVAVVQGRSSILFATLAGVSLGLFTGGTQPIPGSSTVLRRTRLQIAIRALFIWAIGIAMSALGLPVYIILPAYAILFLLAIPLLTATRFLLTGTVSVVVVITPVMYVWINAAPWWDGNAGAAVSVLVGWPYPFLVWIAFIVSGLVIARCGVTQLHVQVAAVGIGTLLAGLGYGLAASLTRTRIPNADSIWADALSAQPHSGGILEVVGSGGVAVAVIGLCGLITRTRAAAILLPLRAVGSMPLTAYVLQLVVWFLVAHSILDNPHDLTAFRTLQPFWPMTVGIITACTAWALLIGRGPLEQALTRLQPSP
ncbi:DUF418 domain-containing protein [Gordonia sp. IITR100]|uniref:DUF418 domain-containing protein n=1 Tax=Gordonia sp. IITR100 TaxID=1314686 RepID=UPI000990F144|nr:DUF418 domain-containing protein [Gordonia sp. IITR100]